MDNIIQSLQNINKKHLFRKKVILVSSYLDGNAFKKNLTLKGLTALNLCISTIFDIARDMCFPILLKNGWEILDSTLGQLLTLEILRELHFQGKLSYFKLPIISPSFARSIFRTIKEIRVSGYSTVNFPEESLKNSQKMQDIFLIMSHYEQKLKFAKLIDEADLYSQAEKLNLREEETLFLIPHNIPMNELELRFFKKTIEPRVIPFTSEYSETYMLPHETLKVKNEKIEVSTEEDIFNRLQHREEIDFIKLPPLDIEFYQAHGEYNEVREVFRKIMKELYPYDRVQVFYTTQEPYSQYFYQLSRLYGIPVTFHSGINIKNSLPAQFLFSLLDWIDDNYSIDKLIALLSSSCISMIPEDSLALQKIISLLRQSPIGWGRERYLPGLDLAIEERKRKMENTSEEKIRELSEEVNYLLIIKEWIERVFQEIPDYKYNFKITISGLAGGLLHLVKNNRYKQNNNIDQEALHIISHKLDTLKKNINTEYPVNEAIVLIKNTIEQERINCSAPLPGHLHIASYKKGIWIDRCYTFFIGMDYQKFPGNTDEDMVLITEEKKDFQQMVWNNKQHEVEQIRLLQLILSQKGTKYLSFSCYDTITQREQVPANFVLQLYRLKKRDISIDYNTFYKDLILAKSFIPQNSAEILDEGELFLFFSQKENMDLQPFFNQRYESFREGIKAEKIRKEEGFNIYNGKIRVDAESVDPRVNRGILLSASKLERIAYCPYLYFLADVLKIRPMEEMVYDPTVWLSPKERGLLLHQIYEQFYRILFSISKNEKIVPLYNKHWPLLESIIEECLVEKRKHLAPPGELIYQSERAEIIESGQIFLKEEEEIYRKYFNKPQYFELAFGTRDSEHEILGKIKSVELVLPDSSKISVQGKIDRVDLLPDGTFRIIDYKTGRSDNYKRRNTFCQGQQIQHALYAISLERILNRKGNKCNSIVSDAGYYFPTVAGKGNFVLYSRQHRDKVLEIIETLLAIVAKGNFAMIKKADDFMCLDYKDILEQNETIVLVGAKAKENINEPALEEIRGLQKYE